MMSPCPPKAGTTHISKREIPLTGKRRMNGMSDQLLGRCTKDLTQFRHTLRPAETSRDWKQQGEKAVAIRTKHAVATISPNGLLWRGPQQPLRLSISRAFINAVDAQSLDPWEPCCRTQYTALLKIPQLFPLKKTTASKAAPHSLKFHNWGPTSFWVHRLQLFEFLSIPPARAVLDPGIHVSRQSWPSWLYKYTTLVQAPVVNTHCYACTRS